MIDRLFNLFKDVVVEPAEDANDKDILIAAVSLMLEVARSDNTHQQVELETIESILVNRFQVDEAMTREMMSAASEKVEAAHDLYQFTQLINDEYSYAEKEKLLTAMWQVAFADGHVQSIEDHIIRRVAGLIHLPHEDFIRLKLKVRSEAGD